MLRTIVWYFSNGWLFLPFALLSSELRRHGSCMIWRNTASITERITVVLAIPDTTTIGEGGGGGNHTHSSTYHRQTSLYSPCDTRQSFKHNSATYIWNEKEPINNRGDSLYLEITCACLIGNKVLVVGNTDVRFDFTLMASPRAPRPRALAGHVIVPWARQQRGVAVRHGSAGSSLSPDLRRQERNATLV